MGHIIIIRRRFMSEFDFSLLFVVDMVAVVADRFSANGSDSDSDGDGDGVVRITSIAISSPPMILLSS
ncbi:hypothetical protein DERP_005008 [Dermatophagoides pteronyssinus]|uniref:Secreted peptide n=1 Tax=Dermatophagoides pteronyssinus TaxID=6956 RepID=A0ABQ8JTK9_DERPT|nr:hypothetical protein DERP_005008 [Dermatophagoides pteronyssinus]